MFMLLLMQYFVIGLGLMLGALVPFIILLGFMALFFDVRFEK